LLPRLNAPGMRIGKKIGGGRKTIKGSLGQRGIYVSEKHVKKGKRDLG